jgi:universal stress protein A
MFKRILLPVDLTDKHAAALDVAARLAEQNGAEVTLLHVVEVIPGLSMEEERTFYGRLERMARSHLQQLGKPLAGRSAAWRVEVRFGKRAAETVRYAEEAAADLLIVTGPPVNPDNPLASLQSMSYTIGMLSRRPVLVVK